MIAPSGIINAVAVADIEAVLTAIAPDGVLNEPGKGLRKSRVELLSIDAVCDGVDNFGAATGAIAGRAIGMARLKPGQDAGPMQKIVHQGINGNHAGADLDPEAHPFRYTEQNAGQGHREDLV